MRSDSLLRRTGAIEQKLKGCLLSSIERDNSREEYFHQCRLGTPSAEMAGFVAALANPFNYIGGVSFSPEKDIPDLSGKVALVTGGMFMIHPPRKLWLV